MPERRAVRFTAGPIAVKSSLFFRADIAVEDLSRMKGKAGLGRGQSAAFAFFVVPVDVGAKLGNRVQRGIGRFRHVIMAEHGQKAIAHEFQDMPAVLLDFAHGDFKVVIHHPDQIAAGDPLGHLGKAGQVEKNNITALISRSDPRCNSPLSTRWPASRPR
ncbi:hypothetical protein ACFOHS_10960 [Jhaorihella thermophila]